MQLINRILPFLPLPACQTCAVCERPAMPSALVCVYCGEDLPQRRTRLFVRSASAIAAVAATTAFVAMRGGVHFPGKLTLPGGVLVALGAGLALLLPNLHGVAGATRRERLWPVAGVYFGGIALALLTALAVLAACAPKQWTLADAVLGVATTITLPATPMALGFPWHKLIAGILLAAGLALT